MHEEIPLTNVGDPHPEEHDWQSRPYVERWIASATARQSTRRPELRRLVSLLPCSRDEPIRILDVGGGHGEVTEQVLEEWPNATVVLQDFSGPMLAIAGERFANDDHRVEFSQSDLTTGGWSATLNGPFDAAVSAIAIHNVGDPKIIRAIYAEVFSVLKPGGAFFNLDYLYMAGPATADLYQRMTGRSMSARTMGVGQSLAERASLLHQLQWFTDIGFDEVDCLWKEGRQAALCGLRTSHANEAR